MATPIGQLSVDLLLQSTEFVRSINRASEQVNQLGRAVNQQNTLMARGFTAATSAAKSFAIGMAAAVGAGSIGGIARLGKQALDSAGNLGELAQQAGVATGELQALQLAGVQVGVSQEQLVTSMGQFGKRVGEAAIGTGTLAKTMERYGISARDSSGQVRSSVDILGDFADAVEGAGSQQEQLAIATAAFGRAGAKLLPLLSEGAEGFREWMETAEAAGLVLSPELVARADAASDALATLQFAVSKGFEIGVVEAFNAELNTTVERLIAARTAGQSAGTAVGTLLSGFADMVIVLSEANTGVRTLSGGLFDLADAISLPAKQLKFLIDQVARLAGATAAPDTSLEALAPPEIAKRIQALEVDIKESTGWLKGWREELAAGAAQADSTAEATGNLATAAVELTAVQKRLAEAGQFLKETTAAEERALLGLEQRMLVQERLAQTSAQKEKGLLPPVADQRAQAQELSDPFENALASVQAEFTTTFEQMQLGGIQTFEDIADAAQGIFANLNANVLSLAIFDPDALAKVAQRAGLTGNQLAGAAAATTLAPGLLGAFGANQAAQGASMGGAFGAGAGALAGSFFGNPLLGSVIGAGAGTALGGLFGGLFGGGGGGSQVSFGGSALGKAGAGGTGEAAKFVAQIDTQLIALMNFRQEKLTNAMLSKAQSTSVQYGEEGPSANDLAALAGARIRPAAAALGFSSAVGRGAPEQQMANLQQAVTLMQQVQAIDLGPLGSELETLKTNFLEASKAAQKFEVDHYQALEEQYKRERQAISRRFASERVGLEEMFGQRSSTSAALYQLKLQFDEAGARAEQLGLSTAGMGKALAAAKDEVLAQVQAQRAGILDQARGLASLPQTFKSTFDALMERFTALRAEMRATSGSTAELTVIQRQATAALVAQRQEQLEALRGEARGLVGRPETFQGTFDALMDRFLELRTQTRALGGDLTYLTNIQKQATAALFVQRKAQLDAISTEARGLVGLPATFKSTFDDLMRRFLELRAQARALGGGLGELTALQKQATAALQAQRKEQQQAIVSEAKGLVDLPQTFRQTFDALMNRFLELREAMRATGGGLGVLTALQQQATAALLAQRKAQLQSIQIEAQGLTGLDPTFQQEFDALMRRFLDLRAQTRALGGDLTVLTQVQREAQKHLIREQQLRQDQMALSVVTPFKQLLTPLQQFQEELGLGLMNPAGQMEDAAEDFRRITLAAQSGDLQAIESFQAAAERFIEQAGRFGSSPAQVAAIEEVQQANRDLMSRIEAARREAERGMEDVIKRASQREIDTMRELVAEVRIVAEEIKRLGRR